MKPSIESLVDAFEARLLSRRELIASLTALTAGTLASDRVSAQAPQIALAAQGRTLNHASLAVSDVERSAKFYSALLGLKEVSRPGNGGINLGLGTSFLGLYNLANPGTVNHICLGVDDFDPNRIATQAQGDGADGEGGHESRQPDERRRSAVLQGSGQHQHPVVSERISGVRTG